MPEYIRSPYAPDQRTMLDLMRLASTDRSRADRERAAVRAQGVMNIGQLIASTLAGIRQEREQRAAQAQALQRQEHEDAFKRRDQQIREADVLARIGDREEAAAARAEAAQSKAGEAAYKRGGEVAEQVGYGPMSEMDMESVLQGPAAGRARYSFGPGTADGPELMPTKDQARAQQFEQWVEQQGGQIGPTGQPVFPPKPEREPNPTEASLALLAAQGDRMAQQALQTLRSMKREPAAIRQPIWVVGPDGQFRDLAGVAPPGSKPANTREQGRPVTSGDAGRVAELDTSIDDLAVLSNALSASGSTGTQAKIGASVPNWVTEYTGWGTDAKKKQALIDRVKQVIGKALEGGVLRKEDEVKYEKILPTVGDPNDIVVSKLSGLSNAINLRRTRTLESLSDAGYDVSRFEQRTRPSTGGTVTLIAPDGSEKDVPADQVDHYLSLGAKRKP